MCEISGSLVLLALLICSISDIKRRGVYTWLMIVLTFLLCGLGILRNRENFGLLIGGILVGAVFLFISYCSKESIGYADSWLILLLGIFLGWKLQIVMLTISFVLAAVAGGIGLLWKKWKKEEGIPFVPFLAIGYLGVMLF